MILFWSFWSTYALLSMLLIVALLTDWPEFLQVPLRHIRDDRIAREDIVAELDERLQFPGVTNAWTMPIKARIDMLTTGVRTQIGRAHV